MKDNPWHLQIPTAEHEQWFKNLIDLHQLTIEWSALATHWIRPQEMHSFRSSPEFSQGFVEKFLQSTPLSLSELLRLDNLYPTQTLQRFEHSIWLMQAKMLQFLYEKISDQRPLLDRVLEQTARKLGETIAQARWKKQANLRSNNLEALYFSLHDSPFSGYPHSSGLFIRRAVISQIQIEFQFCPHQIQSQPIQQVADDLCRLHGQWIQGFTHALNPHVQIQSRIQKPRCIQIWSLPD